MRLAEGVTCAVADGQVCEEKQVSVKGGGLEATPGPALEDRR